MKTYKCPYKQCKYDNQVSEDEAVRHNNRYYHKECLQEMENKKEIRRLFYEHINPTEVASVLNRNINNIVDVKKVPSDFLLFALKYVIKYKLPLNHAGGMHYIINNDQIKQAYRKVMARKVQSNEFKIEKTNEVSFSIKTEDTGWGKILQQ